MLVTLDGIRMTTVESLHCEIQSKLGLPSYYGQNLDALWDCLTAWVEIPLEIEWENFDAVQNTLGDYALKVLKTFQDANGVTIVTRN